MNLHTCHRSWEPKDGGWSLWAITHCDECCARALLAGDGTLCPKWEPAQLAGAIATLEIHHALDFIRPFEEPSSATLERIARIVRSLPFRLSAFGLAMSLEKRRR